MAQITWSDRALAHLIEISDRIAEFSPIRAEKFAMRAFSKVELLEGHPEIGQQFLYKKEKNLRQLIVNDHIILYRPMNNLVEILAIFYGRRDLQTLVDELPDVGRDQES